MVDAAAGCAAAVDCRLDDRSDLAARLGLPVGAGDETLLIAAYRAWGDDLAAHLTGDFAGVVWDWSRQRLLAFRDPLGARPLFYGRVAGGGGLAVAGSEEALIDLTGAPFAPDDQMVVEHLTWEYQSLERTFWRELRRLPGGHVLVARAPDDLQVRRYWSLPALDARPLTVAAAHERFRELFFQSVRRRLDGPAPLLAHLSGGVDSSLIVCAADRIYGEGGTTPGRPSLTAVSARYPGLACDEGVYIDAVTAGVGFPSQTWPGLSDRFPDLDDPSLAGPGKRAHRNDSSFGEFDIAARLGARAILSGEGGDHLGGPFGVAEEKARRHPLRFVLQTVSRRDLSGRQRLARARFLTRVLAPVSLRRAVISRRVRGQAPSWLLPGWRSLAGTLAADVTAPIPSGDPRARVQAAHWRELTSARLAHALELSQRAAADHGVEMRFPYLDQDLVRFVLSLPLECWPPVSAHARLQREALGDLLPEVVRRRTTKALFGPVIAYNLERTSGALRALFFEGIWACERWVDRPAAQRLLDRALSPALDGPGGDDDDGSPQGFGLWRPVWGIATLEAWLRSALRYDSARRRVAR